MKSKLFILTKMLMNSGAGWSMKGEDKKKKKTNKVVTLFLIFVVIPLILTLGFLSFYLTLIFKGSVSENSSLILGLGISAMTMFFFGLIMIPGIFYYAEDIEYLLPLPVSGSVIVNSKLFSTWIWENLTAVFICLPIFIGFAIASPPDFLFYLISIIILFTISIVPMLYGIIINMLMMRFTPFGKNKDTFSKVSSILTTVFSIYICVNLLNIMNLDNDGLIKILVTSDNSISNVLLTIFPQIEYAVKAMYYGSILDLLIYLGITAVWIIIYLIVAKLFYFSGLLRLTERFGHKKHLFKSKKILKENRIRIFHSSTLALIKKEWTNLVQNPTFFSACISSNFIIPMIIFFLPYTQFGINISYHINNLYLFQLKNDYILFLMIIAGVGAVSTGMNYISSTSISREGHDFMFLKYMPVKLNRIVFAKTIISILIGSLSTIAIDLFLFKFLKFPVEILAQGLSLGLSLSILISLIGLLIDIYNPILNWTEEHKAVKENFNGILTLFLCILIPVVYYFILKLVKFPIEFAIFGLFLITLIFAYSIYLYLISNMENLINRLEEF